MPIFGFLKKKKFKSTFSEQNHWERRNDYNQPIRYLHNDHEYKKLNKSNQPAKKDVHDNVYRKGTLSELKRYFDSHTDESIMVKTIKIDNKKYIDEMELITHAKNEAEKMLEVGMAYDYIQRRRKKTGIAVDIVMPFYGEDDLFEKTIKFQNAKKHTGKEILQLLNYALGAMKSVQDFHDNGWIHFDVKLENFVIDDRNNKVHLIDPELAMRKEFIGKVRACKIGGTPEYAAPELFLKDHLVNGEAVDIHSMGIVLAGMLDLLRNNGKRPDNNAEVKVKFYFDPSKKEDRLKILKKTFKVTDDQAEMLFNLVCSMTTLDPNSRPSLKTAMYSIENLIFELEHQFFPKKHHHTKNKVFKINNL